MIGHLIARPERLRALPAAGVRGRAPHAAQQVFTHPLPGARRGVGAHGARASLVALAGIVLARLLLQGAAGGPGAPGRERCAGLHRLLTNKYYVDELYGALFVRGLALGGGSALYAVDRHVDRRRRRRGAAGARGQRRSPGSCATWWPRFSNAWDRYVVDGAGEPDRRRSRQLQLLFRARAERPRPALRAGHADRLFFLIGAGSWFWACTREPRMDLFRDHLLSVITYTPLRGRAAAAAAALQGAATTRVRWFANGFGARSGFLVSLPLWFCVRPRRDGLPVRRSRRAWIPSIGVAVPLRRRRRSARC